MSNVNVKTSLCVCGLDDCVLDDCVLDLNDPTSIVECFPIPVLVRSTNENNVIAEDCNNKDENSESHILELSKE